MQPKDGKDDLTELKRIREEEWNKEKEKLDALGRNWTKVPSLKC